MIAILRIVFALEGSVGALQKRLDIASGFGYSASFFTPALLLLVGVRLVHEHKCLE